MELAIIITFIYIIPAILSVLVMYHKSNKVTRGDLLEMIFLSLIPIMNFIVGYLGGLVIMCESITISDFFNKRIK